MKYIIYILMIGFFLSCTEDAEDRNDQSGSAVAWFHTRSSFDIVDSLGCCKMLVFNSKTGDYIKTVDITEREMNFSLLFNPESYIFAFIANDSRFSMNEENMDDWKRINYYNTTTGSLGSTIPAFPNIKEIDTYKAKKTSSIYFDTITNISLRKRGTDTLNIDLKPVQAKFSFTITCDDAWFDLSATLYTPRASYLFDKDSVDKMQLSTSGVFDEEGGYDSRKYLADNNDFKIEKTILANGVPCPTSYSYETYLYENLAGTILENQTWTDFIDNGNVVSSLYKTKLRQQPTYIDFSIKRNGMPPVKTQRIYIGGTQDGVLNLTDYNVRRGYHYHYDIDCTNFSKSSNDGEENDDISFVVTGSAVEPF